jgi:hypothetical protein
MATTSKSSDKEIDDLKTELAELKAGIKELTETQKSAVATRREADKDNKTTLAVESLFDFFKAELVRDTPLAALGVAIGAGLATKALLAKMNESSGSSSSSSSGSSSNSSGGGSSSR